MDIFTFIILVTLIGCGFVGFIVYSTTQKLPSGRKLQAEVDTLKTEISAANARIAILEKLATDEETDIKRQFRDLQKENA